MMDKDRIAEAREFAGRVPLGRPLARELDRAIGTIRGLADALESRSRAYTDLNADYDALKARTEIADRQRTALVAAAGVTPQEPGEVCAWCPNRARGDAWHNDGKLYPSCGSIGHGGGWVPPYFPHSAIDEVALSEALLKVYDHGSAPNALKEARVLIASRAEWLRGGGQ